MAKDMASKELVTDWRLKLEDISRQSLELELAFAKDALAILESPDPSLVGVVVGDDSTSLLKAMAGAESTPGFVRPHAEQGEADNDPTASDCIEGGGRDAGRRWRYASVKKIGWDAKTLGSFAGGGGRGHLTLGLHAKCR